MWTQQELHRNSKPKCYRFQFNISFRSVNGVAFRKMYFFAKNMLITPNQNGQKQIGAQTKWRKFTENGQNTIKTEGWSISIRLLCPEFQSSSFFLAGFNEVSVHDDHGHRSNRLHSLHLFWALQLLFVYIIEIKTMPIGSVYFFGFFFGWICSIR